MIAVHEQRPRLAVALLGACLFLPGLAARDLWNPDEPRYAEVAREMRLTGEYLVPHLNGEVYDQKPPVFFWAIVGASLLTGEVDELAARLPSALAAIGTLLLVFGLGERLFGRRAAWIAVAAFATSTKVLWQARVGQIDMLLTFLVALQIYLWVRASAAGRPSLLTLLFAVGGVATLTKGPAGFLPPLLTLVVLLVWEGDVRGLRDLRIGRGLVVWAAVVALWLVPVGLRLGGDYLEQITVGQNLERYFAPGSRDDVAGHLRPWYYYLQVVPVEFFPWSLMLLPALRAFRSTGAGRRRWWRLLVCWVVVTLTFFSLSPAKRTVYVLPMYPALALMVGAGLDRWARRPVGRSRWITVPLATIMVLGWGLMLALPWLTATRPELDPVSQSITPVAAVAALALATGATLAWGRARRGDVPGACARLALGMGCCGLAVGTFGTALYNPLKTVRPLAETIAHDLRPGETYGIYPGLDPPVVYYTERYAVDVGRTGVDAFLGSEGAAYLLVERDRLGDLSADSTRRLEEVDRSPDVVDGYVLFRITDRKLAHAGTF